MQVRFGEYLPHTGPLIRGQVGDQCATEIHDYQICHTKSGDQITRRLCAAALNCILEKLDPTTAYNLQAANVLLGLTPTMLSLVGNAPAELSLLAFSGRPVLAFMLNVGAPVIAVTGTFKYQHPLEVLNGSKSPFPTFHGARSVIIAFIEYILAAAAAINVGLLASDISRKAVYVPNCGRTWYAWLWMYMCLVLYPLSLFTFWSRVNIQRSTWKFWLSNETTHCASRTGICYSLKDESYLSLFLEWVLCHGAIIQIIFGTLVLSASTLVVTPDAIQVIGRFAASAILCRLILMYELYGLRAALASGAIRLVESEASSSKLHTMGPVEDREWHTMKGSHQGL